MIHHAIQLQKKPTKVQVANFMTVTGQDAQNAFTMVPPSEDIKENLEVVKETFQEHFTQERMKQRAKPSTSSLQPRNYKQRDASLATASLLESLTMISEKGYGGIQQSAFRKLRASAGQESQPLKEIAN